MPLMTLKERTGICRGKTSNNAFPILMHLACIAVSLLSVLQFAMIGPGTCGYIFGVIAFHPAICNDCLSAVIYVWLMNSGGKGSLKTTTVDFFLLLLIRKCLSQIQQQLLKPRASITTSRRPCRKSRRKQISVFLANSWKCISPPKHVYLRFIPVVFVASRHVFRSTCCPYNICQRQCHLS